VWERARRLGLLQPLSSSSGADGAGGGCPPDVRLLVENRVESIAAAIVQLSPAAVVVDSIQTVALRDLAQRPGSITQVGGKEQGEVLMTLLLVGERHHPLWAS
jgi:predicted ATP-dependent serine protease